MKLHKDRYFNLILLTGFHWLKPIVFLVLLAECFYLNFMKNVNVCFFASKHHTELHTREKIFLEAYLLQDILECRTLIRQNFLKTKLNLPVF